MARLRTQSARETECPALKRSNVHGDWLIAGLFGDLLGGKHERHCVLWLKHFLLGRAGGLRLALLLLECKQCLDYAGRLLSSKNTQRNNQ